MRRLVLLCLALLLAGCAGPKEEPAASETAPETGAETVLPETALRETEATEPADPVREILEAMTLEEKVGQLFLARCRKETALDDIRNNQLGGLVLFGRDFDDETLGSMQKKLKAYRAAGNIPLLLAVDEEGGTVVRISSHPVFRGEPFPSPRQAFQSGGLELALSLESEKAYLLHTLGLNVNLAPVCDIALAPGSFLYSRSLGTDPVTTGQYVSGTLERMAEYGVGGVMKHFPGYGENGDTHVAGILDSRSLEELEGKDLIPFRAGIQTGLGAILVSHNRIAALDADAPASLSSAVIGYLRDTLAYDRVVITDDLSMGALEDYTPEEAAVLAVKAGADLLCSTDFESQLSAVLEAARSGEISQDRLDEAVYRVLSWKAQLGLIG